MKTHILTEDPNDNWAKVELYRWQHGNLPGENGTKEMPLDISQGLITMANAITVGCQTNDWNKMPAPFNISSVMKYTAKLINKNL